MLFKSEDLRTPDITALIFNSKKILDFMMSHRAAINALIQNRAGYVGKQI
jgi:hypothetical protein